MHLLAEQVAEARFAEEALGRRVPLGLSLIHIFSRKSLLYDKNGEEHYNLISALHKSMRNSDPDAAVYWLARMLEAGEDPLYIARRLIRFASEDVGLADPRALELCVAAYQACHFLGMPECNLNLTQAVVYPVSYTHLDNSAIGFVMVDMVTKEPHMYRISGATAVSYTHLDVYKRQLHCQYMRARSKKAEAPS